jgi:putative transposase
MAWTKITRRKYRRDGLRYASNLTDEEWARDVWMLVNLH